jgi:hypothetical protein
VTAHADITANVRVGGAGAGAALRLIVDGAVVEARAVGEGDRNEQMKIPSGAWFTTELRAPDGVLVAITNPIFVASAV